MNNLLPNNCLLASIFMLALAIPAVAQVSFGTAATYASGGLDTSSIVVRDLNGDNKPDLVVANAGSGTLGVLLNKGTGTFPAMATTYASGSSGTLSLAVGDVNVDGKPDLVAANATDKTVRVLLGTGTGSFAAATTFSTGSASQPSSLILTDVNDDGWPDILVPNPTDKTLGVLLGNGTGSFPTLASYPMGNYAPRSLAAGDFNNDGRTDVVATLSANSILQVMLNNGQGAFSLVQASYQTGTNYQTGSDNQEVELGDINADGLLDIVSVNPYANALSIMPGNGNSYNTFVVAYIYPLGSGNAPTATAIGDINKDGRTDLVMAYSASHSAAVLLGLGDGLFQTTATLYPTGSGSAPRDVALADLNGDTKLDIITANSASSTVGIMLNTSVLATRSPLASSTSPYPNPAHSTFAVQVPPIAGASTVWAELRNALGQLVHQQTTPLPATGTRLTVATAGLPIGLYTLHLRAGEETLVQRVLVE